MFICFNEYQIAIDNKYSGGWLKLYLLIKKMAHLFSLANKLPINKSYSIFLLL